ncbi:HYC_CC_PP family protein [Leeuwenhoekiella sp. NPDC079379]|uniref:HYC_CC_PP family protein n=1 Tax=Leeuwenhoekiella sp. NPDC079379 TaxID=3364122 RepID=UPI0037C53B25
MKQVFNQIMAVLMAFVVLCTTMSFTVNMHYCGDTLVDYSLTNHAKSCGMEVKQDNKMAGSCDTIISTQSCCSDKTISAEAQDDLKPVFHPLDLEHQFIAVTFLYSYVSLFNLETLDTTSYTAYSPPTLIRDTQTLDQVFII